MSTLPDNTILGSLELIETYIYYDQPVLFACRNTIGTLYLAVLESEEDEFESWLYVAMSHIRFESVRSGYIDLKTAFKNAENGFVFAVQMYFDGQPTRVGYVDTGILTDDQLPLAGRSLNLPSSALAINESDLVIKAKQSLRDHVLLSLQFADNNLSEAPAKVLGEILEAVQDVVVALSFGLSELYSQSKKISRDLMSMVELSVLAFSRGSFQVEMASSSPTQLFERDLTGNALQALIDLMNLEGTPEELLGFLAKYNKVEVSQNYLKLLQAIGKSRIERARLDWASPIEGRNGSGQLTVTRVFAILKTLQEWTETDTQLITVTGELTGLFVRKNRRFEIIDMQDKEYRGIVSRDVAVDDFEIIKNATMSRLYRARLRQVIVNKVAIGQITTTYELLGFDHLLDSEG